MAAGVHALPVDALWPAATWMRAWSDRSVLHVLAIRHRQACPAGTAIASMHALPFLPCRVCPDPGTGATPRSPNHVKSLSRGPTSSLSARVLDVDVEIARHDEGSAGRWPGFPGEVQGVALCLRGG